MTLIQIGHCAYSGANAAQYARSKARAIEILRQRGVTRNEARAAVNAVCLTPNGYAIVSAEWGPIEVSNIETIAAEQRWPIASYTAAQLARLPHRV